MKTHGTCTTHARTDVSVRDITVVIDEPAERGGSNLGPSRTEAVLASLTGCTNRITHKIAVPFPEIRLTINLTTNVDDASIGKLKADLARFCPVSKVIRQSGTEIIETWNVTRH